MRKDEWVLLKGDDHCHYVLAGFEHAGRYDMLCGKEVTNGVVELENADQSEACKPCSGCLNEFRKMVS